MEVPITLTKKLNEIEDEEKTQKHEELRNKRLEQQKVKQNRLNEEQLLGKKIALAKKIFRWKDDFLSTKEGKKVLKRSFNQLGIFGGGWEHGGISEHGHGFHSHVFLSDLGIDYRAGYKWHGYRVNCLFRKVDELAQILNYKYLQELWDEINSGKIYKRIEESVI